MTDSLHSSPVGKLLYGFAFVVLLPVLLVGWASLTEAHVALPAVASAPLGISLAVFGVLVMVTGMVTIAVYGDGLPMNLYPPKYLVSRGIYRIIHHPIYAGFCMMCVGVALATGSRSGLWLISPLVMLGCTALVQGYERPDLLARFGTSPPTPFISLPGDEERPPLIGERVSVYILVLGPWVVLYEIIVALGVPRDAIIAYLPFERGLPVIEWTELFYVSTYLIVFMVPLSKASASTLRRFCIAGLIVTASGILAFIILPLIAPPREFRPGGFLGQLLQWERQHDTPAAAFPSFHVAWAILSAYVYARTYPSLKTLCWAYPVVIAISCVTTGMHALVDVAAGVLVAWAGLQVETLWEALRRSAEHMANSWKEWHIGPVRIINHGIYAGAGTFLGVALVGIFLGAGVVWQIEIVALCSLVCAGLWAQLIEGSPSLLRPYGYYGGVIGIVLGALLIQALGGDAWLLLAGFAVAGPVIQAMGRLRCLVQGCCHGRPASERVGIRYTHPRSRVCRLAQLAGVPIHPTPLYSIMWNVIIGVFLARLWSLEAPLPLICGLYLILNGLGRFVEEAYRGEPQTPILGNLRLYQVMAITSVAAGIILTMVRTSSVIPSLQFSWMAVAAAACFGLVTWFALGVDFPNSDRRFARLS